MILRTFDVHVVSFSFCMLEKIYAFCHSVEHVTSTFQIYMKVDP